MKLFRFTLAAILCALVVATGELGPGFQEESGDTIVWSSYDGVSWWFATVLEGRFGSVEVATSESALLVSRRWTQADGDSWLSLIGMLATQD